jgi:hypothetical protein
MKKRLMQLTRAALAAAFLLFIAAATDGALAQESGKNAQAEPGVNAGGPGGPGGWGRDEDGDGIPNGQDPDYDRQNPMRGHGQMGFIDENGDGINDRCLDSDGDGIPNRLDPDWEPPRDGTGSKHRWGSHWDEGMTPRGGGICDGTGPKGGANRRHGRR